MSALPNKLRHGFSGTRFCARLTLLLVAGAIVVLLLEHWRGKWALQSWKSKMEARGEVFDRRRLVPRDAAIDPDFSNALAQAVAALPKGLSQFQGLVAGMRFNEAGNACRGSTWPTPASQSSRWGELDALLVQADPALEVIRLLMERPPRLSEIATAKGMGPFDTPPLFHFRIAAQSLAAAAVNDLHRRDQVSAARRLEALQGVARVYCDDPVMVTFMIRVAITGVADSAFWDALQEDGWSDQQLARLQRACDANVVVPQMAPALAGERLAHLETMEWLGSHHYQEWIDEMSPLYRSFGRKAPEDGAPAWEGLWRRLVFHPIWRYAWRDQEELQYLRFSQQELEIYRGATDRWSWIDLYEKRTQVRKAYRKPAGAWRFYGDLPHGEFDAIIETKPQFPECPYPEYGKGFLSAANNATMHEMVRTVIAMKRYRLAHEKWPETLHALIPEYLAAVPRDYMDGRELRYRRSDDGNFVLYSVGEDGKDDGGDAQPAADRIKRNGWPGKDWVWPQAPKNIPIPRPQQGAL